MEILSHFLLPIILLALTLGFGLWVSLAGRPYKSLLFNIHKLAALGAVVFFVIRIVPQLRAFPFQPLQSALLGLAALCVLALFATGAVMSIGTKKHAAVLTIHRAALFLLPLAAAASLYLLIMGGSA